MLKFKPSEHHGVSKILVECGKCTETFCGLLMLGYGEEKAEGGKGLIIIIPYMHLIS